MQQTCRINHKKLVYLHGENFKFIIEKNAVLCYNRFIINMVVIVQFKGVLNDYR